MTKFARDSPGNRVMGSLLGMQNSATLEVTDCFVIPAVTKSKSNDEGEEDESLGREMDSERMQSFKDKMLNAMRAVNADFDEVGLLQVSKLTRPENRSNRDGIPDIGQRAEEK